MMEAKIQKQIIDFYSFFEEFHNSTKTCLKDCQSCAITINKFVVRCKKIKEAEVSGTPLEEFEGLQGKLTAILHNLISEEIKEIRSNLSKLEDLFEKLCNKHKALQESCKEVNFTQQTLLVKGTPFQPSLKILLEFAEDIITFGSEACALIYTSLEVLSFKGLSTDPLVENFKISPLWQKRITEILGYTSFIAENQI